MKIKPFGDRAVLIELEHEVSTEIHNQIISLSKALENFNEIDFTIPAYNSLTVSYNPKETSYNALKTKIESLTLTDQALPNKRYLKIPVCYNHSFAPDLVDVANQLGKSTSWVVESHLSNSYNVYMLGFMPGFAYMGKFAASVKRKSSPRKLVPKNSIGLAGWQTGIYPSSSPGGWQIIGQTPIPVFDPKLDDSFLFKAGDTVTFYNISPAAFKELKTNYERGIVKRSDLYD